MKKLNLATNVDFVKYIMEYAPTGALSQVFVISALDVYSRNVLEATKENWPMNSFIDFDAWQRTAKFILESIDQRGKS